MSRKKVLWMIWTAAVVWAVACIQILTTKFFVSNMDMTQAFARNQLVIENSEDAEGTGSTTVIEDGKGTEDTTVTENGIGTGDTAIAEDGKVTEDITVTENAKGTGSTADTGSATSTEDTRNTREGNKCVQAFKTGRLSTKEMADTAKALFQTMGGSVVMDHVESGDSGYYVAYGYTTGLDTCKKVNGHRVNMNVAIQYDETKGRTCVTMGTPLINSDI